MKGVAHLACAESPLQWVPQPSSSTKQDCTVDGQLGSAHPYGQCIQSPGYATGNDYGSDEACTFNVLLSGYLSVASFVTQKGYDEVAVLRGDGSGSAEYSGDGAGPQELVVAAGDQILWRSNGGVQKPGWEICLIPIGEQLPWITCW